MLIISVIHVILLRTISIVVVRLMAYSWEQVCAGGTGGIDHIADSKQSLRVFNKVICLAYRDTYDTFKQKHRCMTSSVL